MDLKLGGKFQIGKKLGAGAFGEVYIAKDTATGEDVAVKVEDNRTKHPQLLHEAKLLKLLKGKGIPELKGALIEGDYNVMVLTLLGPSLEHLFNYWKQKFSMHTTLMFGVQALERIEHIQACDFLHRDIKPDNFLIGNKKASMIYLIDFGLAKRFRNQFYCKYKMKIHNFIELMKIEYDRKWRDNEHESKTENSNLYLK